MNAVERNKRSQDNQLQRVCSASQTAPELQRGLRGKMRNLKSQSLARRLLYNQSDVGWASHFCFGKSKVTGITGDGGARASSDWRDTRNGRVGPGRVESGQ